MATPLEAPVLAASAGPGTPSTRAKLCAACVLVVAGLLAFGPSLRNGFILDDDYMLVRNASIRSLANLPGFFVTTPPESINRGYYRPIMLASFALDYAAFGLSGPAMHFFNIVWHAAVSWLVWRVLQQLGASLLAASLAALVFALHPLQGEVVYLITYRANALSTLFFLLGLSLYLARRAAPWSAPALAALGACYFCSLACKETGAILPLAFALVDFYLPAPRRPARAPYVVCGAVLLAYALIRHWLCEPSSASYFGDQSADSVLRAMVVVEAYALTLLAWPRSLAATYDDSYLPHPQSFADPLWLGCAVLLLGLVALAFHLRRRAPRVGFCIAFYLVALLPTYNIVRLPNLFGERFMYLPMLGACFCLCVGLDALTKPAHAWAARLAVVVAALLFGAQNHARAHAWRSEVSYWTSAVAMRPQAVQAHVGLAKALHDERRCAQALPHYAFAIQRVAPRGPAARPLYGQTASCLSLTGDQRGALAVVERWLVAQPGDDGFARMRASLRRTLGETPAGAHSGANRPPD